MGLLIDTRLCIFLTVLIALVVSFARAKMNITTQNVLGNRLALCSIDPITGFERAGKCTSGPDDSDTHTVCAVMTSRFLDFTKRQGNDLTTPSGPDFPGLSPGHRWCLCALRWGEGLEGGHSPPVILEATGKQSLRYISVEDLRSHAA
jgi:uncharacterized protein